MQTLGEIDREDTGCFDIDPDLWIAHNCRYCKNIATCSLYRGLIDHTKEEFNSNSLDCPWVRYS